MAGWLPEGHGMDPRVFATACGLLRPRMTKGGVCCANWQRTAFARFEQILRSFIWLPDEPGPYLRASRAFVILGRQERSELRRP